MRQSYFSQPWINDLFSTTLNQIYSCVLMIHWFLIIVKTTSNTLNICSSQTTQKQLLFCKYGKMFVWLNKSKLFGPHNTCLKNQ